MVPYGLRHQVRLGDAYTSPIPGLVYDPYQQLSTLNGSPLVGQPDVMRQYSVTWQTTDRDNKTDAGG